MESKLTKEQIEELKKKNEAKKKAADNGKYIKK